MANSGHQYIGYCYISSLAAAWFASSHSATATLTAKYGGTTFATHVLETTLSSLQQPAWYGSPSIASAGVYATAPVSPLYAGETFSVLLYAHTGGYALSTFGVWLNIDKTYLEYVSFSQNSDYQTVTKSETDTTSTTKSLRFTAVGIAGTAADSDVTGTDIHLVTVTLKVKSGTAAGVYNTDTLKVHAKEFINPGSFLFLEDADGVVFDAKDAAVANGRIEVRAVADAGLFAYSDSGTLANLAVLDGADESYEVHAVVVDDDDRDTHGRTKLASSAMACTTTAPASVLSLSGCDVVLTTAQTEGASAAIVNVTYSSLAAHAVFDVYFPPTVVLTLGSSTLKRIEAADGTNPSCANAQHYQQTRITATIGSLDATDLVSFTSSDTAVAAVSGRRLTGVGVGTSTVYLTGRTAAYTSVQVAVSADAVTASQLIPRVVTDVDWATSPPTTFSRSPFTASALAKQELNAEGTFGYLFVRVLWSDDTYQDVSLTPLEDVDELNVTALSTGLDLTAPTYGQSGSHSARWKATVATGAQRECGDLLLVRWQLCNAVVGSANVPMFLEMPSPTSVTIASSVTRLASPSDNAAAAPVSVATTARMTVTAYFDDGSSRDMSTDERVVYTVNDAACASFSNTRDVDVNSGATCTLLNVTAAVFGFSDSVLIPVVSLSALALDFTGYPNSGGNAAISVTQLGLVSGTASSFHHATARVKATLSDSAQQYDVTSATSFSSNNAAAVTTPSGSRMYANAAGTATITASWGLSGSKSVSTADLTVVNSVLNAATAVDLVVSLSSGTLNLEAGGTSSTTVRVTFTNGLYFSSLASLDWLSVSEMIVFGSSHPAVVSVDADGTLTQHDNSHEEVTVNATLSSDATVTDEQAMKANLKPAAKDVDFGASTGFQFVQTGSLLAVPVRIRSASGKKLINFQVKASFDDSILTSNTDSASGGSASYASGTWSGVTDTLNNPPGEFQLVGSDASSTLSGEVDVGTVQLNVVGSGVTLITGEIVELISSNDGGTTQDAVTRGTAVVAGEGYADVTSSRRRRAMSTPAPVLQSRAERNAARRPRSQRQLQACDACASRVYGDVNEDCAFTSADVLKMSQLAAEQQLYNDGNSATDPIAALSCEWLREQANPSQDVSGSSPVVNLVDAQYLQFAVAKKYRFLANSTASCADGALELVVRVLEGDTTSSPDAAAASLDVLFEVSATGFASLSGSMTTGTLNTARGLTGADKRLLNAADMGGGVFKAVFSSSSWTPSTSLSIAILLETKDSSGNKEVPRRYKSFHGSSIEPYATQGISFSSFLSTSCSNGASSPPPPPPPAPSPPPPAPPAVVWNANVDFRGDGNTLSTIAPSPPSCVPADCEPIQSLTFSDGRTTTLRGATSSSAGLVLATDNEFALAPPVTITHGSFSIESLVTPTTAAAVSGEQRLVELSKKAVGESDNYAAASDRIVVQRYGTTDRLQFSTSSAATNSFADHVSDDDVFAANNEVHVVVTYEAGSNTKRLYVNGREKTLSLVSGDGASPSISTSSTTFDHVYVGRSPDASDAGQEKVAVFRVVSGTAATGVVDSTEAMALYTNKDTLASPPSPPPRPPASPLQTMTWDATVDFRGGGSTLSATAPSPPGCATGDCETSQNLTFSDGRVVTLRGATSGDDGIVLDTDTEFALAPPVTITQGRFSIELLVTPTTAAASSEDQRFVELSTKAPGQADDYTTSTDRILIQRYGTTDRLQVSTSSSTEGVFADHVSTGDVLAVDAPVHVVVTYDASTNSKRLYVNGEEKAISLVAGDASSASISTSSTTFDYVYVGRSPDASDAGQEKVGVFRVVSGSEQAAVVDYAHARDLYLNKDILTSPPLPPVSPPRPPASPLQTATWDANVDFRGGGSSVGATAPSPPNCAPADCETSQNLTLTDGRVVTLRGATASNDGLVIDTDTEFAVAPPVTITEGRFAIELLVTPTTAAADSENQRFVELSTKAPGEADDYTASTDRILVQRYGTTNRLQFSTGSASEGNFADHVSTGDVLSADTPVHVVATYDASTNTKRMYVNGEEKALALVSGDASSASISTSSTTFSYAYVGRSPDAADAGHETVSVFRVVSGAEDVATVDFAEAKALYENRNLHTSPPSPPPRPPASPLQTAAWDANVEFRGDGGTLSATSPSPPDCAPGDCETSQTLTFVDGRIVTLRGATSSSDGLVLDTDTEFALAPAVTITQGRFSIEVLATPTSTAARSENQRFVELSTKQPGQADNYTTSTDRILIQRYGTTNRLQFSTASATEEVFADHVSAGDVLVDNTPVHVVATYDASTNTKRLYVNGEEKALTLVSGDAASASISTSSTTFDYAYVGRSPDASDAGQEKVAVFRVVSGSEDAAIVDYAEARDLYAKSTTVTSPPLPPTSPPHPPASPLQTTTWDATVDFRGGGNTLGATSPPPPGCAPGNCETSQTLTFSDGRAVTLRGATSGSNGLVMDTDTEFALAPAVTITQGRFSIEVLATPTSTASSSQNQRFVELSTKSPGQADDYAASTDRVLIQRYGTTNRLQFSTASSTEQTFADHVSLEDVLVEDTPVHVVATYDANTNTKRLYVNGKEKTLALVSGDDSSASISTSSTTFNYAYVGRSPDASDAGQEDVAVFRVVSGNADAAIVDYAEARDLYVKKDTVTSPPLPPASPPRPPASPLQTTTWDADVNFRGSGSTLSSTAPSPPNCAPADCETSQNLTLSDGRIVTLRGATSSSDGLVLDTDNEFALAPPVTITQGSFSIELLVTPTSTASSSANQRFVELSTKAPGQAENYTASTDRILIQRYGTTDRLQVSTASATEGNFADHVTISDVLAPHTPVHVVVTYEASTNTKRLYVDGEEKTLALVSGDAAYASVSTTSTTFDYAYLGRSPDASDAGKEKVAVFRVVSGDEETSIVDFAEARTLYANKDTTSSPPPPPPMAPFDVIIPIGGTAVINVSSSGVEMMGLLHPTIVVLCDPSDANDCSLDFEIEIADDECVRPATLCPVTCTCVFLRTPAARAPCIGIGLAGARLRGHNRQPVFLPPRIHHRDQRRAQGVQRL